MRRYFRRPQDSFLRKVPGVIHIGANLGQERDNYAAHGLNVIWVEPIPEIFGQLQNNIAGFPKQHAYKALLADCADKEFSFRIANNDGQSSSIFDLAKHRELWPEVDFTREVRITATTLDRLVERERIEVKRFGALVLDTQGAELLVLKGSLATLNRMKFVLVEAADFEAYAGCCQLKDIDGFLTQHGFRRKALMIVAFRAGVGTYSNVLYQRRRFQRARR